MVNGPKYPLINGFWEAIKINGNYWGINGKLMAINGKKYGNLMGKYTMYP